MAILNMISNPGFEDPNMGWTLYGTPAYSTTDQRSGSRCLKIPNPSGGGMQQALQVRTLEAGSYTLTFWAKRSGRMDVWAGHAYTDASGVRQMFHGPSLLNSVTSTYSRQSYVINVPPNILYGFVTIYLFAGGNPGDVATAWIDDVDLPVDVYNDPTGPVGTINTNGVQIYDWIYGSPKTTLNRGAKVSVVASEKDNSGVWWYEITYLDYTTVGYVHPMYVGFDEQGSGHPAGVDHLVNAGFETADAWSTYGPTCIVTDQTMARTGNRYLRLPYKSTIGVQYARQNVNLSPGKEYILSFYARRFNSMDIRAGHGYFDANGIYQDRRGLSLLNSITNNVGYSRQEYRFTIPTDARRDCSVYIYGENNTAYTMVEGFIDDVKLVRTDGQSSEDDKVGQYGWVYNVNSDGLKLRDTPVNGTWHAPNLTADTRVLVKAQETHPDATWYRVETDTGRVGWVSGNFITWTNPAASTGKKYVKLINNNVIVRDTDLSQRPHTWPKDRIVIVSPRNGDSTYYNCRYRGVPSLLKIDQCVDLSQPVHSSICDRMEYIVANEENRSDPTYFDGATGNYCQTFVEWMAMAAYLPINRLPQESNTAQAIIKWCTTLGGCGVRFFFKTDEHKAALKAKYSSELSGITATRTQTEINFQPQRGDHVYFLWNSDKGKPDPHIPGTNIVVSHVDYVYKIENGRVYVWGNKGTTMPVGRFDYPINDDQIVGYARPDYSII